MDKKNTNLDELLKIIAASGAGIPIAGISVMVKKVDEEACDCGHGKSCDHSGSCDHNDSCDHNGSCDRNGSCDHCTSKSSDCCDDDDDPIDFNEMLRFIRRRTGMCERMVLAVLAAQMEYLDSVIDEEDEA